MPARAQDLPLPQFFPHQAANTAHSRCMDMLLIVKLAATLQPSQIQQDHRHPAPRIMRTRTMMMKMRKQVVTRCLQVREVPPQFPTAMSLSKGAVIQMQCLLPMRCPPVPSPMVAMVIPACSLPTYRDPPLTEIPLNPTICTDSQATSCAHSSHFPVFPSCHLHWGV